MNRGASRAVQGAIQVCVIFMACLLIATSASGQAAQAEKPLMADDIFTNIQAPHRRPCLASPSVSPQGPYTGPPGFGPADNTSSLYR